MKHFFVCGMVALGAVAGQGGTAGGPVEGQGQKEVAGVKEHKSGDWSPGLNEAEKQTLSAIVEDTLKWCVAGEHGAFSFDGYTLTPKLKADTATFVTLKIRGQLRGCIGCLEPVAPLYKSVHENAVSAALHDYRFEPVTSREVGQLEIQISILSPIRAIASLDEFKIGEHGIIIEKGMHRAVYLPEVAAEQHWTVEETLMSLSTKAGLDRQAWRDGARFKVFSSVALSKE
jgi:MEMO1 family protein